MKSEVIDRLSADAPSYTPFDCGVMDFGSPVELPPARLTIVEGAYSLHPYFGEYYDLAVFVTADLETRLARIGARPGHNNVEIADYIVSQYAAEGCDTMAFQPIVSFGPNAADPHHEADNTRLEPGQCIRCCEEVHWVVS